MTLTRNQARAIGIAAIGVTLLLHTSAGIACYRQDIGMLLTGVLYFLLPPLIPALLSLLRSNPLGAATACLFILPWLGLAIYTDCIRPYTGGGASLAYVTVPLFGTPGAIFAAIFTPWLCRRLEVHVVDKHEAQT